MSTLSCFSLLSNISEKWSKFPTTVPFALIPSKIHCHLPNLSIETTLSKVSNNLKIDKLSDFLGSYLFDQSAVCYCWQLISFKTFHSFSHSVIHSVNKYLYFANLKCVWVCIW